LLSFVDLYERFVMLLKLRSRTHHPHMFYSYTGGERHPPNKCSKFLLLSLKSFVAEKRHWAMQKLFIKKEREKVKKKWISV
jgi:hypothetical protein